jgi:hypothetical protein
MKSVFRSAAMIALAFLSGCAEFQSGWWGRPSSSRPSDYYARSDLDELLRFGGDLAKRTSSYRADECRRLLKRQQETPGLVGIQLHLMTARLLSDACGDAWRIADSVSAIPPGRLPDQRVQWLVATQAEALKRLGSASRRVVAAERKQKAGQGAPESPKDEARILREKLEAIRSMERRLDKTGSEN